MIFTILIKKNEETREESYYCEHLDDIYEDLRRRILGKNFDIVEYYLQDSGYPDSVFDIVTEEFGVTIRFGEDPFIEYFIDNFLNKYFPNTKTKYNEE